MKQKEPKLVKERKRSQSPKTVTSTSAAKQRVTFRSANKQRTTRKSEQNPQKSLKLDKDTISICKPSSSTTIPIAEKLSDHCSFDLAQASKSLIFPSSSVQDKDTSFTSQVTEKRDSLSSVVETKQSTARIDNIIKPETIAHYSSELNTEALRICNENLMADKTKVAAAKIDKEVVCETMKNEKTCDQSINKEGNPSEAIIEKKEEVQLKTLEQTSKQSISEQLTSEQPTLEQPQSEQSASEMSSKDEPRRSGRKRSTKSFGDDTITFPLKKEKVQTPLKSESTETSVVNKDDSGKSDVAPTRSSERKRLVNSKYRGEDVYTPTTKKTIQQEKLSIDHNQGHSKLEKKIIKNNPVNITSAKTTKSVDTSIKVETRRRSSSKSVSNEQQHSASKTKKHEKQNNTKPIERHRKSSVQDEKQVEVPKPIKLEQMVSKPIESTAQIVDDELLQAQKEIKLNETLKQSPKTILPPSDEQFVLPEIVKLHEADPKSEVPFKFDKQPELASNIKLKDTNVIFSKSTVLSRDERPIEVFSNQIEITEKSTKSTISIQDEEQLDRVINIGETPTKSIESVQDKKEFSLTLSYGMTDSIQDSTTKGQIKEVTTENLQTSTDLLNLLNKTTNPTQHNKNFQTTIENISNKTTDPLKDYKQSDLLTSYSSLSKEIEKPTNTICIEILPDNDLQKTTKTKNEKPVIKKAKVEKPAPGKAVNKNFEEKYELFKQKWKAEKEKRRLMKETLSAKSVSVASQKPLQVCTHQPQIPQPKLEPISLAQISTIKNTSFTDKDQLVRSSKEKLPYSGQQGTKTGPTLTQLVASKLHKKAQAHQKQKQEAEIERKTSTEKEEIDLTAITLHSMKSPPRFEEKSSNSKKKSLDFITGRLNYKKKMELLKSEVKHQKGSTDYFNLLQSPPLSAQAIQDSKIQTQYHYGNHITNPVNYDKETLADATLKITLPSSSNCSLLSQTTPIADYKNREMKTPDKTTNKSKGLFASVTM